MLNKRHFFGLCCFVTLISALCWLLAMRNRPVLLKLGADIRADHDFEVLNPLRNRDAEGPAEVLLMELKAGRCSEVLGRINAALAQARCPSESEYPINNWSLDAIDVRVNSTLLRYRVHRTVLGSHSTCGPFWIWDCRSAIARAGGGPRRIL